MYENDVMLTLNGLKKLEDELTHLRSVKRRRLLNGLSRL